MLAVEELQAGYGPAQVLFDVSFSVGAGEVVTLLGRNGMGKTTTVRSIMGIAPPRAGTISFAGRAIHGLPPYRVAQAGLGLVPEGRQVFPNLTVRENLELSLARPSKGVLATLRARLDGAQRDRVEETLEAIGLGHEHARTPIVMLIADLDVRVIAAATGELLRHLTLNPDRDYQPLGRPPGPPPRKPQQPDPR